MTFLGGDTTEGIRPDRIFSSVTGTLLAGIGFPLKEERPQTWSFVCHIHFSGAEPRPHSNRRSSLQPATPI